MGDAEHKEVIVMTPRKKTQNSTTIVMERQRAPPQTPNNSVHIAGGQHAGLIINKALSNNDFDDMPSQLSLEFKVFLVNAQTEKHTQEQRLIRFWFKNEFPEGDRAKSAQDFFKSLVSPQEFPRNYTGFMMKIMKLMQLEHPGIRKVQVELTQLGESDAPPERPLSMDDSMIAGSVTLTEEKVLEMIESAYPTPISMCDIMKQSQNTDDEVRMYLNELQAKGLIKVMENSTYTRVVQNEIEVQFVKQMPAMGGAKQPSIAIITAQYCEKLAVDAMIENKETYFRYNTVGESNVYTLGNIGDHRVVSTKLPTVGHTREAMIAAGNTTTRLLGTFQNVDYVFLVGVAGGVPHYTDFNKHVRLGDVVVASPVDGKSIYYYCDSAKDIGSGSYEFESKAWGPPDLVLQEIAYHLKDRGDNDVLCAPWLNYLEKAMRELNEDEENIFTRPPDESDKLYMSIGGKDVIEVAHPPPPTDGLTYARKNGLPQLHLGPVASGRHVVRDDQVRQALASYLGILAFASEFDAVIESIYGNRKDSYVLIRGISDYKDGSRKKEWQPYAALAAASFMKAIICTMVPPVDN